MYTIFILPALCLSGLFFGVRQILRSSASTLMKVALILLVTGSLLMVYLVTLGLLLASSGGFNH